MSEERNLTVALFEELGRAPQALVNDNVERKVPLTYDMLKIRVIRVGCSINHSDYIMKISKLTREVQGLAGLVESKDYKSQMMPWLVKKASRLREELSKFEGDRDGLTAVNKVVVALEPEISELKRTTSRLTSSYSKVKAHAAETKRGLKRAQKTAKVSNSY